MNKFPVLSGAALLLLIGAQSANAANFLNTCNGRPMGLPNASVAWSVSSAGFPAGGTWDTALRAAIARVNDNPSRLRMSIANNSDTSVAIGNGQNEIWFSGNAAEASPAVAYNYYDCNTSTGVGFISESDVLFYNGEPYTADMTVNARLYGYGGGQRPFQTTAVHEFGHALGLAHSNSEYNVMGTDFYFMTTNAGVGRAYLGADASDGAVRIYGAATTSVQDVSLSHWKYSGASGAYSSHAKTILANASGTELSSTIDAGEKRYAVTGGQTVQLELTRENSGQSAQSARIGYYLSTDNRIDAADRQLAVETLNVGLGDPTTWRRTLTLPTGLATGKYWLGAIIDDNNAIAERVEDNNAMYIPVSYTGGGGGGNQPPAANFSTSISGLTVTFTDGSTDADGSIASRSWSFGDGTTSTAVNPTKTYVAAGTYTVSLTVTDNQGASNTTSRSVTVSTGGGGLPECTASRTDELGRNCARSNLSASTGSTRYFYLLVPAGTSQLRITTSGGTGNADLYYSASSWATPGSYTLRSVNAGNGESITVNNPPSGYVYISVHAAASFSGVKVSTEY